MLLVAYWLHICDHPPCSQWPCPLMNVLCFTHGTAWQSTTWQSRLLPVWIVSKDGWNPWCSPHFMVNWCYIRFFLIPHWQCTIFDRCSNPLDPPLASIANSLGFYKLLSFWWYLSYQTQSVQWFHATRQFSQIGEQAVAIMLSYYTYIHIISLIFSTHMNRTYIPK